MVNRTSVTLFNLYFLLSPFFRFMAREVKLDKSRYFFFKFDRIGSMRRKFSLLPLLIPNFTKDIDRRLWFKFIRVVAEIGLPVTVDLNYLDFFQKPPYCERQPRANAYHMQYLTLNLKNNPLDFYFLYAGSIITNSNYR